MDNQDQIDNQNNSTTSSTGRGGGDINVSGDISGSAGVIIGQNITTGDIMVNLDQSIKQNPDNEYLKGLKDLTKQLSKEYEEYGVPEAKRNEINKSIQDLQTEVKDIKPATKVEEKPATKVEEKPATKVEEKPATKVEEKPATKVEYLSLSKQKQIDAKTTSLVEQIVDALPETSETIANLIPFLSPFSKMIRGGVENLVNYVKKYNESES